MILLLMAALAVPNMTPDGEPYTTQCLDSTFVGEGASGFDVDGDGAMDVVAGSWWWAGPKFEQRFRFRRGESFDVEGYSDHFFTWGEDVDVDGDLDIVMVGFPGAAAFWYENPGDARETESWPRHMIHGMVDNESPAFTDIDGDGRRDLVFHSQGTVGWCSIPAADPTQIWDFHLVAEGTGLHRYTHGLGVGDLSGDGLSDFVLNHGWWEQPSDPHGKWVFHSQVLSQGQGGAQILIHDWDGDGDADVFTSLNAHGYGLSWFENRGRRDDGTLDLKEHPIMGAEGSNLAGGLAISELHALTTTDLDGDGLLDVVTGKRFMSHSFREAGSRGPAWIIGLRQDPSQPDGFSLWPIHADSGVGTQVCATDMNGDGHADFVTASKRGIFVHQRRPEVPVQGITEQTTTPRSDPFPEGGQRAEKPGGGFVNLDFELGNLSDWTLEGEAFEGQPIRGDTVVLRRSETQSAHAGSFWIGGYELHQDTPTGRMTSIPFSPPGRFMAFLIAGGSSHKTRLEVLDADSGEVLFEAMGRDAEELRPGVIDLGAEASRSIQIALVDEETGGWGHLNVDHIRFYQERPDFPEGQEVQISSDRVVHEGLSPKEAAAAMSVPAGFHVDLIAGEPDLHQPIALWIDDGGRLWVAEAHSYPKKRPAGEGLDRIVIFEDSDQDGTFETKKVFCEGLNLVSGMAVGFGGVFVGQAPELLFIADRNGDDVPDGPPVVLLDGWGYEDTHETLNAFTFGPDGWLYGCHGVFTHSRVGAPGTPDEDRVPINAGVWRFHPTAHQFEVFAEGTSNPWGVDFNAQGEAFVSACVIPHFYHLVPGARYLRQAGQHFNPFVFEDLPTIADHRHYIGDNPHGGNGRSELAGGGHAHCGLLIYQGQQFPEEYQGGALFFNVHGNRMNHDLLTPDGATWIAGHGDDLVRANDTWFRGIAARTGPAGEVFFIDWYDPQACHHNDTEIWNRTNGRLFRLRYGDQGTSFLDLRKSSPQELLELALTGTTYASRRARRRCQERGLSPKESTSVEAMLIGDEDPAVRLRALWLLQSCGALMEQAAVHALTKDSDPTVRAWAARSLGERINIQPSTGEMLVLRAEGERDPVVLRELASAAQRVPNHLRWNLVTALANNPSAMAENSVLLLTWYGLEPLVPLDPARALALARNASSERIARFVVRRCAAVDTAMPALVSHLLTVTDDATQVESLDALLQALGERRGVEAPPGWSAAFGQLKQGSDGVAERAVLVAARFGDERAFGTLRSWLAGGEDDQRTRLAFEVLTEAADPATHEILLALIENPAWQQDVLRNLGRWPGAQTTSAVLAHWTGYSPAAQREAVATLTSNASGARAVLEGIRSGSLGGREILAPTDARRIVELGPELSELLNEVWGTLRPLGLDRVQQVADWKQVLTTQRLAEADLNHGRAVYAKTCQRCHVLYGIGETVGPELTGSNRTDLDYLLRNLIDPSAEIPADYRATIVATHEGRIVNGVLLRETDEILVLASETGRIELAQSEVEARRTDPNSLMPEGQLDALEEAEVVDLVAYLGSSGQVPRRLLAGEGGELFDGKTLAGWSGADGLWSVEQGEIVGRAKDLEHNEYLISDHDLRDFRLVLEIQLTPDSGNSGIQVRSQPFEEHSMQGFQVDAGQIHWGTLYEVHGRNALVTDVPSAHRAGEWNTYEILYTGSRIQVALNGIQTIDLDDEQGAAHGRLGFQLHQGQSMIVRFRNLKLELDPAEPGLKTIS